MKPNDTLARREAWQDAFEIAGRLAGSDIAVGVQYNTFAGSDGWPVLNVGTRHGYGIEVQLLAVPNYGLPDADGTVTWHWDLQQFAAPSTAQEIEAGQSTRATAKAVESYLWRVTA